MDIKSISVIEDTRNQAGKHKNKHDYFAKHGIRVVRSKLPAGDYALLTDMSRVIDTKQGLQEICGNLTQDHERFKREADFCMENGIEFIVLIEEPGIKKLEDIFKWENPRMHNYNKIAYMHKIGRWANIPLPKAMPTSNATLFKIMRTFGLRHKTRWEFCDPKDSGETIIRLLTEGKVIEQKN